MKNKSVLLISSRPIYPLNGGDRLRLDLLLRLCNAIGDVTVLFNCFWFEDLKLSFEELSKNNINYLDFRITKHDFIRNVFKTLLSNEPIQNLMYSNNDLKSFNLDDFDVVLCHLSRTEFIIRHKRKDVFVDLTDNLLIHYNNVKFNFTLKSLIFLLEKKRFKKYYKSLPASYKKSFISERDLINKNDVVLRNDASFKDSLFDIKSKNILFIGNFSSYPNKQAVEVFLSENLELLASQGYKLFLIGKNASRSFNENKNYIVKIDYYSDLLSLGLKFKVGIAPMKSGAGLQNKILDYLCHGLPVITTSISSAAFPDPEEMMIVEDNIGKYSQLIKQINVDEHYANKARGYLNNFFSFDSILKVFRENICA